MKNLSTIASYVSLAIAIYGCNSTNTQIRTDSQNPQSVPIVNSTEKYVDGPIQCNSIDSVFYKRTYNDGIVDISKLDATKQEDDWLWNGKEWIDICRTEDTSSALIDTRYMGFLLERYGAGNEYISVHNHVDSTFYIPPSETDLISALFQQIDYNKYNLKSQVVDANGVYTYGWNSIPSNLLKSAIHYSSPNYAMSEDEVYRMQRDRDSLRETLRETLANTYTGLRESYKKIFEKYSYMPRSKKTNDGFKSDLKNSFYKEYPKLKKILKNIGLSLDFIPFKKQSSK